MNNIQGMRKQKHRFLFPIAYPLFPAKHTALLIKASILLQIPSNIATALGLN
ncbi:MAG: hypothetical protein QNJ60_08710 [Xenococcaceae cyanobacterium MO_188.B19]|nr:hypothetical protein [Xenococcaceae cyanobacterium MO_188.B19]